MPEDVQYMLASMLSLKGEYEHSTPVISFNYTQSDPNYFEKILNLKWGLHGNWRSVSLIKVFGEEEGFRKFCETLHIMSQDGSHRSEKDERLAWLYKIANSQGVDCSVPGANFDEGIRNLFKKLTVLDKVKVGEDELFVPQIIMRCETPREHVHFYRGFVYVSEEKSFKNISWPNETPNYVKPFFEMEQTMLRLFNT